MMIRYGYEIALTCAQPTALVCLLSVHEDRAADIRDPEKTFTTPIVPVSTYRDLYGNRCLRLVAPKGDFMIWGDATVEDDGMPDPVVAEARETQAPDLPNGCLLFLLGSRYCETDRLSQIAWDTIRENSARLGPRAGDLRFRARPHPFRLHAGARHTHRIRSLS